MQFTCSPQLSAVVSVPGFKRSHLSAMLALALAGIWLTQSPAATKVADTSGVGTGSIALVRPTEAKEPPANPFITENIRGPIPTNDWWTSLVWSKFSQPHFPHPLAVEAGAKGFRVAYPGQAIHADKVGIMAGMPGAGQDFVIGHSEVSEFPDARLDGFSDWFVTAMFAREGKTMRVSYGHGSPFVYVIYQGGQPQITFGHAPQVWSGDASSAVLGVTIDGRHYGLFGPGDSTWKGVGSKTLACQTDKPYFSVAVLPDATPKTLDLFRRYAYAHVVDTKVQWNYDPKSSTVTEQFSYKTKPYEGEANGTLFALYPHQWSRTTTKLLNLGYNSVRGPMKLGCGSSFTVRRIFPGVLPTLPDLAAGDQQNLRLFVEEDLKNVPPKGMDTYWGGKRLGKLATLIPIAQQCGAASAEKKFRAELQSRLEGWFTATPDAAGRDNDGMFYYNRRWGTLIGYPASYGSDNELNDHHFHYGYFIKSAAEIARHDPAWAADERWGGMVKMLIRDIASPNRTDRWFPWLRNFDPYAGHSWASGAAMFADGNNQESSSEAMNAWTGLILWGETAGDRATRDLGIYLYTSEMDAINDYWFDVLGQYRPKAFTPSVVTMVWGAKGVNETWFTRDPEMVHGINWLPLHGGSLYLGLYPDYVRRNYEALVAENGGAKWRVWGDLALMYRALDDSHDALRQFDALANSLKIEGGNSKANTYHWIKNLAALGQMDRTTTADYPLYAVFRKGNQKSYVVYNMGKQPQTVTFSNRMSVLAKGSGFTIKQGLADVP